MIPREISFLLLQMNTYSFCIALALLVSGAYVLWKAPIGQRMRHVDVLLAALIGGLIVARAGHVWLWWAYFQDHTNEIIRISAGGLNWHGALIGGLFGLLIAGRLRQVEHRALLASMAFVVPLLGLATWAGCAAMGCAYGAEVDSMAAYPPIMTWIAPDIYGLEAARFNVQGLGALAAIVLVGIAILLQWRGWLMQSRFWLIVLMWCAVMFALGFLRGDDALTVAGLRQDQWWDVGLALYSLILLIWGAFRRNSLR